MTWFSFLYQVIHSAPHKHRTVLFCIAANEVLDKVLSLETAIKDHEEAD